MALTSKRSGVLRLAICAGVALAGALAKTLHAGVFDEPDVPRSAAVVLPVKTPAAAAVVLAPATGPAWPRLPVPPATQQALIRKECRKVFASELADPSATARRALAERLLTDGGNSKGYVEHYVLLAAARQSAIEAGDLLLCNRAIEALATRYDVDAGRMKLDAAMKCVGRADTAWCTADNARAAIAIVDALVAADDLPTATRLAGTVLASVAGDPLLAVVAEGRAKDCEAIKTAREQLAPALEKLKVAPNDEGANLAVGKFHCFTRGDWGLGLEMLSRGVDPHLRQLATRELARPQDATALLQLADEWWDWARQQQEPARRAAVQRHALTLYSRAQAGLTEVQKAHVAKCVGEAAHFPSTRLIDLLPACEPRRGSVHGAWSVEERGLLSATGLDLFELPYEPPEEYLFRVEFTRLKGNDCIGQLATKAGTAFTWTVGAQHGAFAGFDSINGKTTQLKENPSRVALAGKGLVSGRRYVSTVEVRNGRVRGWLDGRLLVDWPTDYHDLSAIERGKWSPRDVKRLGLCTWNSQSVFHRIEVLELTGEGRIIK
jgi:hypothetical protein